MKISTIFLLSIILHGMLTVESGKAPTAAGVKRPSGFTTGVNNLIQDMATDNLYTGRFDRCHVVPWKFIGSMIDKFMNGQKSAADMKTFVRDLAHIHTTAAYYTNLSPTTTSTLKTLTNTYEKGALAAVGTKDAKELAKMLFNIPSNLYPGDRSNNRSIQNNLDPPKKQSSSGRSDEAVDEAKKFLRDYAGDGLSALYDPNSPGVKVKSSDTPPNDTSGDYVKIV